jgi:sporulation protein YlmC with PRC-barrel domain
MTNLFKTTSRAALIAMIAAAPIAGYAQTATTDTTTTTTTEMPKADMNADATAPMATDPAAPAATDDTMTAEAETPAQPVEGQITMQDADTILADDLIGATVYNNTDATVGDIDDLIIGMDGTVKGVVIGVGGFLGLGEKEVAIEMASLTVVNDDAGNPRLITSATEEDLKAAPEFVTAEDQQREADNASMESTGTGGTMDPAPVQ